MMLYGVLAVFIFNFIFVIYQQRKRIYNLTSENHDLFKENEKLITELMILENVNKRFQKISNVQDFTGEEKSNGTPDNLVDLYK